MGQPFHHILSRRAILPAFASPLLAQSSRPAAPPPLEGGLVKEWVIAAHRRQIDPMRELLRKEPALLQGSHDWGAGDTEDALEAAAHMGNVEMARFLLGEGARLELFAAAMLGELAFVRVAIEVFPRALTVPGAHGIPLLSHAVAGGKGGEAVLRFLLEKGVDVNRAHGNGQTAIGLAAQNGFRDTVRVLLEHGANPNAKAKNGSTPLSLSRKGGYTEIAKDLEAAGARE